MGCNASKLESLPAVALCRDRCNFLQDALHNSYALADAHLAYMQSLKTVGLTLHQFFDDHDLNNRPSPPSNGDTAAKSSKSSPPDQSPSSFTSDSHIHFDSDSDEDFRNNDLEPFDQNHREFSNQATAGSSSNTFLSMNYGDHSRTYRSNDQLTYNDEFSRRDLASKTPPPPAPSGSTWDFLNFFEPYEKYEPHYSPNREPKQVKESEEIRQDISAETHQVRSTLVGEKNDDVEKKQKERSTESESKSQIGQRAATEVTREVQVQFEKASESGNEVLKMFDAGKFRYHKKYSVYKVSSKMLHAVNPSKLVVSSHLDDQGLGDRDDDVVLNSRNLTATVNKLCMWEKKLLDEVKAEEKLRILYARKCRQIKNMDGADALKVEAARTMLRTLSTKIKIAIQVIDKMSLAINKLRDEELWSLINELVRRLLEMWKVMLECHRCQNQIVIEAKSLDATASNAKLDDAHLEVAFKLKFDLQNWNLNFSNWIEAQKRFVKALNGWLLRCLRYEPEVTPDGVVPFCPGRIGAPPVFVIVYQWSQAMDTLTEKEVTEAMFGFINNVNQILEKHSVDIQQMIIANKDMDRKVKILEREEQKLQKILQAREKKMSLLAREGRDFLSTGGTPRQSIITNSGSLQSGLKQIFMAIEKFAVNSEKAYDELHVLIEEGRFTQMD